MTSDLTPRQKSVLDFIIAFQQTHRMAPTVREICAHLDLSGPAGIHRILEVLKGQGLHHFRAGHETLLALQQGEDGQGHTPGRQHCRRRSHRGH